MDQKKKQLIQLDNQRRAMEKQIVQISKQLQDIAEAQGYNKPLIDSEGFPRADLQFQSLAEYRNRKRQLNQLNNDHKTLMLDIEKKLYRLHDQNKQRLAPIIQAQQHSISFRKQQLIVKNQFKSFASISQIKTGSLSHLLGWEEGDLLCILGTINSTNCDKLRAIPPMLKTKMGQTISFVLKKNKGNIQQGSFKVESGGLGCRLNFID